MIKPILKIAIIVTDESLEYLNKEEFFNLYDSFIKGYGENEQDIEIITQRFSSFDKEWPTDPFSWDGYIITGSIANAYDQDEWILLLKQRIVELANNDIKIFGICFGHQIIAEALGGKCEKNQKGWELGQHTIKLEKNVSNIFSNLLNINNNNNNNNKIEILNDEISLYQIHQDHVSIIPKDMISIGTTEKSNVQGMLRESKSKPGALNILSFQGHPEFDYNFIHLLIVDLKSINVDQKIIENGLETLQKSSSQKLISKLVFNFFIN
ncbi:hypothetical protein RB653_002322 [Dictyostelium firmibasis]|uniref:Glutamine amidotransferase domain-containing protein n=1 Tax=Dictyostelium firmibasis TaxID=79012 RepID=A0AAN7YPY5_9MYCE